MKTRKRIQALQNKANPPEVQRMIVIWSDPDDPDWVTVNNETMTRAEFEKRFPGPFTVIEWNDDGDASDR